MSVGGFASLANPMQWASDAVTYQQNIENCFAENIGSSGLDRAVYGQLVTACAPLLDDLRRAYAENTISLLRLPETTADIETMEDCAARYLENFDDVVVLGVGGSSLGAKALAALTDPAAVDAPRLHFFDNIDPQEFDRRLTAFDPVRLAFLVISKSGGTAETLSQFLVCIGAMRDALSPETFADRFTIITDPGDNPLRQLADRFGMPVLDHEPGVGGRYSVLSNVGLLPALIAGLDAGAVRDGAKEVIDTFLDAATPEDCPPAVGAIFNVALAQHNGISSTVLMPYIDRLAEFGLWYRQLWAESLGKQGQGTTPVRAIGTVDQHSQLQLYLDGPADKMFTLIFNAAAGSGAVIPADIADTPALDYLAGHRIGDLMDAEQRATAETLARHGRPTRVIRIGHLDERTIGALMMHFMLETIIAAGLLGVDPFDQPAVDEGKVLTREYLGKGETT